MQEHIRRAHPEHYISKLPATEESFTLMVTTPPSERPPPPPAQPNTSAPLGLYFAVKLASTDSDVSIKVMEMTSTPSIMRITARAPHEYQTSFVEVPYYQQQVLQRHWRNCTITVLTMIGIQSRYCRFFFSPDIANKFFAFFRKHPLNLSQKTISHEPDSRLLHKSNTLMRMNHTILLLLCNANCFHLR